MFWEWKITKCIRKQLKYSSLNVLCDASQADLVFHQALPQLSQLISGVRRRCRLHRFHHHVFLYKGTFQAKWQYSPHTKKLNTIITSLLPSISSLFAAGSDTFLEIQLAAKREGGGRVLGPRHNSTPHFLLSLGVKADLAVVHFLLNISQLVSFVPFSVQEIKRDSQLSVVLNAQTPSVKAAKKTGWTLCFYWHFCFALCVRD